MDDKLEIQKKLIKSMFDKLTYIPINGMGHFTLYNTQKNEFGVYCRYEWKTFVINSQYFMFNYIGIDIERWDFIDYFSEYIISLTENKVPMYFTIDAPYNSVETDLNIIKSYQNQIDELLKQK
jgi:hypothetical protein